MDGGVPPFGVPGAGTVLPAWLEQGSSRTGHAGHGARTSGLASCPQAAPDREVMTGQRRGVGFGAQDFFWIALAGSIAGFVLLVFRPNRDRIRAAEAECRLLRLEIESLESNVARLRSWERSLAAGDPEAWGAVARSRAGWVARGEKVMRPPATRRARSGAMPPEGIARAPLGRRGWRPD